MDEAKSIAEAISDVTNLARPVVERACAFAESLLGEPLKVAGSVLADHMYAWQTSNRVRILERTRRLVERAGIHPGHIAVGFLLPALEAMGNVDDDDLQELWAQLLSGSMDDESLQQMMYVETLRRLSSEDAVILSRLAGGLMEAARERPGTRDGRMSLDSEWQFLHLHDSSSQVTGISDASWRRALARLEALNVLERIVTDSAGAIARSLESYFRDLSRVTPEGPYLTAREQQKPDPVRQLGRSRLQRLNSDLKLSNSGHPSWRLSRFGLDFVRAIGLTKESTEHVRGAGDAETARSPKTSSTGE